MHEYKSGGRRSALIETGENVCKYEYLCVRVCISMSICVCVCVSMSICVCV